MKQPITKTETAVQKNKTDTVQQLADKIDMLCKSADSLVETVQKDHMCNCLLAIPKMNRKWSCYG